MEITGTMKKRILLVGKAASGKDYFKDFMKNQGYPCDISYTTRPKREGEIEGDTYNYVSEAVFNAIKRNGLFYESVTFNGWQYGTSTKDWTEKKLCIKTPSGVKQLTDKDREESIIVYFDITLNAREQRLLKRSDADSVYRRIESDREDFKDFTLFNIRITNPTFDKWVLENLIYEYQNL